MTLIPSRGKVMASEIKDGDYHIVRDSRPTSYPYDVMRRIGGRDYRINSFGTEIHARYFAAAQNIARTGEGKRG